MQGKIPLLRKRRDGLIHKGEAGPLLSELHEPEQWPNFPAPGERFTQKGNGRDASP